MRLTSTNVLTTRVNMMVRATITRTDLLAAVCLDIPANCVQKPFLMLTTLPRRLTFFMLITALPTRLILFTKLHKTSRVTRQEACSIVVTTCVLSGIVCVGFDKGLNDI